jgi:endonuclease YncB( thermonuclease family)
LGAVAAVAAVAGVGSYKLASHGDGKGDVHVEQAAVDAHSASPALASVQEVAPANSGRAIHQDDRVSPNAPANIECDVVDGDTLNCQGRRIRLLGIDAPELPGHCRRGRPCVKGDPFASSEALQRLIGVSNLQIVVVGRDKYDRELANVYANGKNVACDLIDGGFAVYKPNWDNGNIVQEDCSISTR